MLRLRLGLNDQDSVLATIRGVTGGKRAGRPVPGSHGLTVRGPAGEEGLQFKEGVVRTQLAAMDVSRRARHCLALLKLQLNHCFGTRILSHYGGLLSSFQLLNQENKDKNCVTF